MHTCGKAFMSVEVRMNVRTYKDTLQNIDYALQYCSVLQSNKVEGIGWIYQSGRMSEGLQHVLA